MGKFIAGVIVTLLVVFAVGYFTEYCICDIEIPFLEKEEAEVAVAESIEETAVAVEATATEVAADVETAEEEMEEEFSENETADDAGEESAPQETTDLQ